MGFSRKEYWSGLPFPTPGDLPNPGIEPASPALAGGFLTFGLSEKPRAALQLMMMNSYMVETAPIYWVLPKCISSCNPPKDPLKCCKRCLDTFCCLCSWLPSIWFPFSGVGKFSLSELCIPFLTLLTRGCEAQTLASSIPQQPGHGQVTWCNHQIFIRSKWQKERGQGEFASAATRVTTSGFQKQ